MRAKRNLEKIARWTQRKLGPGYNKRRGTTDVSMGRVTSGVGWTCKANPRMRRGSFKKSGKEKDLSEGEKKGLRVPGFVKPSSKNMQRNQNSQRATNGRKGRIARA